MFNSLGSLGAVDGSRVLDLFAGSGALGIEALSRGASSAMFVDDDARAIATIRANLLATGLTGHVVRADAIAFCEGATDEWDLTFADPPYTFDDWADLLVALGPRTRLAVLEADRQVDPPAGWRMVKVRRHGGTVVTLVAHEPHGD